MEDAISPVVLEGPLIIGEYRIRHFRRLEVTVKLVRVVVQPKRQMRTDVFRRSFQSAVIANVWIAGPKNQHQLRLKTDDHFSTILQGGVLDLSRSQDIRECTCHKASLRRVYIDLIGTGANDEDPGCLI